MHDPRELPEWLQMELAELRRTDAAATRLRWAAIGLAIASLAIASRAAWLTWGPGA